MKAFRSLARLDGGLIIALALTLFAAQALLKPGLPTSADLNLHMVRTVEYQRVWEAGVLVPRWAPNLAYGYGYPLFIFASPLTYMLGAALQQLFGLDVESAFKALIILGLMLYGGGMYLLARDLFQSAAAGLIAATAYALAPFALREALLYGGNMPQFLAIALFPWSLWSAARAVSTGSSVWIVIAAIFYGGIVLTHLFHVLVFTPVLAAFILLLIALKWRFDPTARQAWLRRGAALLVIPLGLLLSAFFWLPVLTERRFTRTDAADYLEKSPFFIRYPHWTELVAWIEPLDFRAANPYVPLTLGVVTLALATLGLLSLLKLWRGWGGTTLTNEPELKTELTQSPSPQPSPKGRGRKASPPEGGKEGGLAGKEGGLAAIIFFGLLAAGAIFMALPLSRPVWEMIPSLQVGQFPWRMLGLANLGLAVLAGAAILWLPVARRGWAAALCLAVQLGAVAPLLYPVTPFVERGDFTIADQIQYERSSQSIGTTTLGEFLPRTVTRPPETSPLVEAFEANRIPERLDRAGLPPQATATLLAQNAITHRYQIDTPIPFTLRLFHFDYPGWQATLNGAPVAISPEAESGLMLIDIPAGEHDLIVRFSETPLRMTSLLLTGLALAVFAATLVRESVVRLRERESAIDSRQRPGIRGQPLTVGLLLALIFVGAFAVNPLLEPLFTIHSPPGDVLPAQQQTDIRFDNGIRLTGYDISRRVVPADGYTQVVLYWETDRAPYRVNLQPFVHLDRLDDLTTAAGSTNYTPGDVTTESNMPTFHWDNARYVRDEHDLWLPPEIPPQAYAVRVGLINVDDENRLIPLAGDGGDTARLDTINVAPTGRPASTPEHQTEVTFAAANGDAIQLRGYTVGAVTAERVSFDLWWQSRQSPAVDYTVFAQLLDENRELVTSFDRPPLDGAYPTSTWLADQLILDERFVPLADVSPGDYTLIVGLYDTAAGRRMTTPAGADYVELSTITVEK